MPDLSNTPDDAAKHAAAHAPEPETVTPVDVVDDDPGLCERCDGSGDGHGWTWGCAACDGSGFAS